MMNAIVVSEKHQKLLVPKTPEVTTLWQRHAKSVDYKGRDYFVLPHEPAYVLALRNMGFNAPGLIDYHYDWPGSQQPFNAQRVTADMLTLYPRAYVLSDIGVGKTRSALFAADFLMKMGYVNRCLVVAPLSTLTTVWESELFHVMPDREMTSLYHPTKKGRLKRLAADTDFYVINHHGVGVIKDDLMARNDIDCIIIDELTVYRNPSTNLWKNLFEIVKQRCRRYVWGMTGSPIPNGPEDAYGQAKLLTPERVPKSARGWRTLTMNKITQFLYVPKKDALDKVYEALKPGIRFTRDECLDLPDRMVSTLTVQLGKRQQLIYDQLLSRYKARLIEGDVSAANEGVLINKLLQVSCGFVYTNDKGEVDLQNTDRLAILESIIKAAKHKVIVFAPFVFAVEMLSREVSKYVPDVGVVHGSVPKTARDDIFRRFQHGQNMKVLVAHPGCMAHGLTLTSSNVIVWYSPLQHSEIYEQANGRITRAGQVNKQYIVHLCGTPAERRAFARLKRKQTMQGLLLDMFNGVETDE